MSTSQTPSRSSAVRDSPRDSGQSVAPRLVFGLQGAQLLDGRGPPLGPGAASADDRDGRELADGLAGREAGPVSSLALGAAHGHALIVTPSRYANVANFPPGRASTGDVTLRLTHNGNSPTAQRYRATAPRSAVAPADLSMTNLSGANLSGADRTGRPSSRPPGSSSRGGR